VTADATPDERERILEVAVAIADAIRARDVAALRTLLSSDFVHRQAGAGSSDAAAFLSAIERIPGEIVSVNLARVAIDLAGDSALITGLQHARVRLDDEVIDDTRPFVDWLVNESGQWRLRAAVELPSPETP
jgi:ketosteroid isomerase-like protein